MHDLDLYLEAMCAGWTLVPAYFILAFVADERGPRIATQGPIEPARRRRVIGRKATRIERRF